jgi:hypothetical protein
VGGSARGRARQFPAVPKKADLVRWHLEIMLVMGEIQLNPDGRYQGAA